MCPHTYFSKSFINRRKNVLSINAIFCPCSCYVFLLFCVVTFKGNKHETYAYAQVHRNKSSAKLHMLYAFNIYLTHRIRCSRAMLSAVSVEVAPLLFYSRYSARDITNALDFSTTDKGKQRDILFLMDIALPTRSRLIGSVSYFFEPIVVMQS